MRQATLLFLFRDQHILLAMKKRGFGVGRWNGVGGKPKDGELIAEAAIRECQEEIGVTPKEIHQAATLYFYFPEAKKDWNQQVTTFTCRSWQGEPSETEEMAPKWFAVNKIPFSKMWPDDKYWLPRVIKGEFITAEFYFDNNEKLLRYKIIT
jgi:8-oxo-dGTP pyrophosphatase MutT (NUDIX family)